MYLPCIRKIIPIIICLLLHLPALAAAGLPDRLTFQRFSTQNGLSSNLIGPILQDRRGFLWIGTYQGLNRYDGYEFTTYSHDPDDSTSLSTNEVMSLLEDRRGNIWVGTQTGALNRFDPRSETFIRVNLPPHVPDIPSSDMITSLYEDRRGSIWIGFFESGLMRMDFPEGDLMQPLITRYRHDPADSSSLSANRVSAILEDHAGRFWVSTFGGGLCRFNRKTSTFQHFSQKSNSFIYSLIEDREGMLWMGTATGGIHRFNPNTGRFIARYQHEPENPHSLSLNRVLQVYEDREGIIWAGTFGRGLNKFDHESGRFSHYRKDPDDQGSLIDDSIFSLFEDRQGFLWIGTMGGLNRLDRQPSKFSEMTLPAAAAQSLKGDPIFTLFRDSRNMIWIGTEKGRIRRYDRSEGKVTDVTPARPISQSPILQPVRTFFEDRAGNIWIGRNGLDRYDSKTGQFTSYPSGDPNSSKLFGSVVLDIWEDPSGILWLGTEVALNRLDPVTGKFQHFQFDPDEKMSWAQNAVWSVCGDSSGNIWLGSTNRGGISRFDPVSKTFIRYLHIPGQAGSPGSSIFHHIFVDAGGTLWAAGNSGLERFDSKRNRFEHFREKQGLPGSMVGNIIEDRQGFLWLTTNRGLVRFNPGDKSMKIFDHSHGLPPEWLDVTRQNPRTGEIIYYSQNRIGSFYPERLRENPIPPPVFITRLERFDAASPGGSAIREKGISTKSRINLSHRDNILTFQFTALNFRNPEKNRYAYKLEGFTGDWILLGQQRLVTFTNLDPGKYTLRVRAANNDGVWNEKGATLRISIRPPWWKTWWAKVLYALLILGLLYSIRRYEMGRQRLKNNLILKRVQAEHQHTEAERFRELDQLKTRFFANISHEFRTPLTLIQGPVQQLLSGEFRGDITRQYHLILNNCRRLRRLVNQLLDLSRLEAGHIRLQAHPLDIVRITRQIVMAFESQAELQNIQLQFQAAKQAITVYIDPEKYEKALINLLSNALKFTPEGGTVSVDILPLSPSKGEVEGGMLEIRVTDSGIGIPPEQLSRIFDRFYQVDDFRTRENEGTGIGLALTKEFMELHHGTISVTSQPDEGTTFTIRLPLGKKHLRPEELTYGKSDHPPEILASMQENGVRTQIFSSPTGKNSQEQSADEESPSKAILIVEDISDMREYIRSHLSADYRVLEAENGSEGLKIACRHQPALIVSDVMMPRMDGFEFCEKIKTDPRTSHIPVILLTAKSLLQSKLKGLRIGADDYLTKPFDGLELRVRVENLVAQRQRLREKFRRELRVEPAEITVTSEDEKFLQQALDIVEEHISDEQFDTERFSREIGFSRSQLNVKLRALTGCSTREFIRTLRLKRAARLLEQGYGNVAEVAYEVGFNSLSHFAKVFRKQFGTSPSEKAMAEKK